MNTRTKKELIKFINAVEQLAYGVSSFVGVDTTAQVVQEAESLKRALEHDETIPEVS